MIPVRQIHDQRGLSLIEVLVVMAIIAIGTGLALPAIGSSYDRLRLRTFTRELVSDMRAARAGAAADSQIWSMALGEREGYIRAAGSVRRHIEYPQGVNLTLDQADAALLVVFLPSGQVSGDRTILFRNESGHESRVDVDPLSGQVEVGAGP